MARQMINSGFMYICRRDKEFRPVIVVNLSIMKNFTGEFLELIQPVTDFLVSYSVGKINLPGKAETFVTILDLQNVSFYQMPLTGIRKLLGSLQTNFRGRSYKTFILHANMMLRGSWSMVKGYLDEFTASKINFLGKTYKQDLCQYINPVNLEVKYGGVLADKTTGFFPPDMHCEGEEMITMAEYNAS